MWISTAGCRGTDVCCLQVSEASQTPDMPSPKETGARTHSKDKCYEMWSLWIVGGNFGWNPKNQSPVNMCKSPCLTLYPASRLKFKLLWSNDCPLQSAPARVPQRASKKWLGEQPKRSKKIYKDQKRVPICGHGRRTLWVWSLAFSPSSWQFPSIGSTRREERPLNYFACSAGLMFKQASVDVEYPSNLSWLFINPAGEKRENRGLEAGNM